MAHATRALDDSVGDHGRARVARSQHTRVLHLDKVGNLSSPVSYTWTITG